mmetsp:Transcript_31882/g.61376  ORF Transcript_31882/g.61376 Transcript_31882/m.61376 type:complete len:339 (+) Transcript_31882:679-1695(+)
MPFILCSSSACFMRFSIFIFPGFLPWNFHENSRKASFGVMRLPHSSSRSSLKLNFQCTSVGMPDSSQARSRRPFFLSLVRPETVLCEFSVPVSCSSLRVLAKPRSTFVSSPKAASGSSESCPSCSPSASSRSKSMTSSSPSLFFFCDFWRWPAASSEVSIAASASASFSCSCSSFFFDNTARQNSCVSVSTRVSAGASSSGASSASCVRRLATWSTSVASLAVARWCCCCAARRARASDSYSSASSSSTPYPSASISRRDSDWSRALLSAFWKAAERCAALDLSLAASWACLSLRDIRSSDPPAAVLSSSSIKLVSFLRSFFFFFFLGLLKAVISSCV